MGTLCVKAIPKAEREEYKVYQNTSMEDEKIIDLYWDRDENAISATDQKYGKYLTAIARNILSDERDSQECVSDTYMGAWEAMPPQRPSALKAFLAKITRNLSLKRYRHNTADKRGGGEVDLAIDELAECISVGKTVDGQLEDKAITEALDTFLTGLAAEERQIFVFRYWYLESIQDVAARFGYGESKVKMTLKRTRDKLANYLAKEGIYI